MFLVCSLGAVACGDDDDAADVDAGAVADAAAVIDAAPTADALDPADCDPVENTGCPAGSKCTYVIETVSPLTGQTTCAPDGDVAQGDSCSRDSETGVDDCVGGTFCIGGVCEPICSENPDTCGVDAACEAFDGLFDDRDGVGTCTATCDPLAQECPGTEACFLSVFTGLSVCAEPTGGAGGQGADCEVLNGCLEGYGCILSNDPVAPTGLTCAYYCDPTGGGGPACSDGPGAAFTCVQVNLFYSDTPDVPDEVGMCVDCTVWSDLAVCSG